MLLSRIKKEILSDTGEGQNHLQKKIFDYEIRRRCHDNSRGVEPANILSDKQNIMMSAVGGSVVVVASFSASHMEWLPWGEKISTSSTAVRGICVILIEQPRNGASKSAPVLPKMAPILDETADTITQPKPVKLKGFVCYQSLLHLIAKNTTIT
jgi:hypothetical protein